MLLNVENEVHLFCLQYTFLPRINRALTLFIDAWNHHSLSSMQNRTPIQLWISSLLQSQDIQLTNVSYSLPTVSNMYTI